MTRLLVAVQTFNPMATLRMPLVEGTLQSVAAAFPHEDARLVWDNGSSDGSYEWLKAVALPLGFVFYAKPGSVPANTTPGAGRLRMMNGSFVEASQKLGTAIVVFSDDDMVWHDDARARLIEAWEHAPADVKIISGLLEPEWGWNTPREAIQCGAERILVRDSCPAAAWSFRMDDWPLIKEHVEPDFGYDTKACNSLRRFGFRVAQMDLADHAGWGQSTHGNDAHQLPETRPLDREKWGM